MDVAKLNGLRQRIRSVWNSPSERPTPLLHVFDENGSEGDDLHAALRTICSEIGTRFVVADLSGGMTDDVRSLLDKSARHKRIVLIVRIDGLPEDMRSGFHDLLCNGAARTLPIILCPVPPDKLAPTLSYVSNRNSRSSR